MHIMEYKIVLELDDNRMFHSYADEWVNNNAYARYQIVHEELMRDYWTDGKKLHIEDKLEKVMEQEGVIVYRGLGEILYFCDSENKVRLAYDKEKQKILYAREVDFQEVLKWLQWRI